MNGRTKERIARAARQHDVLNDVALKVANVREEAGLLQQSGVEDAGLVEALHAVGAVTPRIHDAELRKRVDLYVEKAWGFRSNRDADWNEVSIPYTVARERLTEVFKQLG
jgi:hypothetical protein